MKKNIVLLSFVMLTATSILSAATAKSEKKIAQQQCQSQPMMGADCSKMSPSEKSFAGQLTDMNNKTMFCSQFTPQQRQQAMTMMGQTDTYGNAMNADQAVQKVMQSGQTAPAQPKRPAGACPVK